MAKGQRHLVTTREKERKASSSALFVGGTYVAVHRYIAAHEAMGTLFLLGTS